MPMKKLVIAGALTAALAVPGAAHADGNNGKQLGVLGQECAAAFGFDSVGAAHRYIVELLGSMEGGVPEDLVEFCGYTP